MFLYDLVLAGEDARPLHFDVFYLKPKFLGALEMVVDVRMVQEDLGGNTTDVQAGAAEK